MKGRDHRLNRENLKLIIPLLEFQLILKNLHKISCLTYSLMVKLYWSLDFVSSLRTFQDGRLVWGLGLGLGSCSLLQLTLHILKLNLESLNPLIFSLYFKILEHLFQKFQPQRKWMGKKVFQKYIQSSLITNYFQ